MKVDPQSASMCMFTHSTHLLKRLTPASYDVAELYQ